MRKYGAPSPAALEFFEKKVRPILVDNCYNCHSANTNAKGGLRVDDRNGLLQGGNSGPAVVPGHPEDSLLLKAVDGSDEDRKMPPKKTLSAEQTADLKRWIAEGAVWPQAEGTAVVAKVNPKYETLRKSHWAWQPLATAPIPKVRDSTWPKGDVDRFLLAKLEAASLRPSADADRRTLIRRVSFDLTGLPPTPPPKSTPSRPIRRSVPSSASLTVCLPRPRSGSVGDATGSTWLAMPSRPDPRGTSPIRMPGGIATMS